MCCLGDRAPRLRPRIQVRPAMAHSDAESVEGRVSVRDPNADLSGVSFEGQVCVDRVGIGALNKLRKLSNSLAHGRELQTEITKHDAAELLCGTLLGTSNCLYVHAWQPSTDGAHMCQTRSRTKQVTPMRQPRAAGRSGPPWTRVSLVGPPHRWNFDGDVLVLLRAVASGGYPERATPARPRRTCPSRRGRIVDALHDAARTSLVIRNIRFETTKAPAAQVIDASRRRPPRCRPFGSGRPPPDAGSR